MPGETTQQKEKKKRSSNELFYRNPWQPWGIFDMVDLLGNRPWLACQNEALSQPAGFERLISALLEKASQLEPKLKIWAQLNSKGALEQARRCDKDKPRTGTVPPLWGMPVGIKDIIDVEGLPTLCGVSGWSSKPATVDSPLVSRWKAAGAILMGKTVTTPCAWLDPPPTRNPWNLERTPGGSSSGSAVALACGLVAGALGTQTGGSLCRPAAYCGVCALKPTFGTWSSQGILPLSLDLDHPGPMARFLQDLVEIHQVFSGRKRPQVSPQAFRLGVPQGMFVEESTDEIQAWMQSSLSRLQASGIALDPVPLPSEFGQLSIPISHLMAFGAWQTHGHQFSQTPDLYPPRIRELILKGAALPPNEVDRARGLALRMRQNLIPLMKDHDAWILPGFHDFPPDPSTTGIPRFHAPWSLLGWPEVAFGVELSPGGLPLALQLVGRPHSDSYLLEMALAVQKCLGHPRIPAR